MSESPERPRGKAEKALATRLRLTRRLIRRRVKPSGSMPGTIVHTGVRKVDAVTFDVVYYNADGFEEYHPATLEDCFPFEGPRQTSWLNVDGLHDTEQITRLGELAHLHPLVIEDIANTSQRPKIENYDGRVYIVMRMLRANPETNEIDEEQLSLVLSAHTLISVQEAPGDVFDPVRDRIRNARGKIRQRGPDYLAYALMDAVVDEYFAIIEALSDRLEATEDAVLGDPTRDDMANLHRLRGELLIVRRAIYPLREIFSALIRDDLDLITDETKLFLRDTYDHAVQIIDSVETLRDVVSGLMELYVSNVSLRMNEVMKVLTVVGTVFIPLTFLVGVYGMNFRAMPELNWPWAYPLLWVVMILLASGMIFHFHRRGWL
jgi:magnesium transporter